MEVYRYFLLAAYNLASSTEPNLVSGQKQTNHKINQYTSSKESNWQN